LKFALLSLVNIYIETPQEIEMQRKIPLKKLTVVHVKYQHVPHHVRCSQFCKVDIFDRGTTDTCLRHSTFGQMTLILKAPS
jgi:hypothetical protein